MPNDPETTAAATPAPARAPDAPPAPARAPIVEPLVRPPLSVSLGARLHWRNADGECELAFVTAAREGDGELPSAVAYNDALGWRPVRRFGSRGAPLDPHANESLHWPHECPEQR
jgi:hypothetical protein